MRDDNRHLRFSRRRILAAAGPGLGGLALATLWGRGVRRSAAQTAAPGPNFPAKAKRAIWLFMAGGPSHLDLFDYKPGLAAQFNQDLPDSVRGTQRLTTMTSGQARFPIAPSVFKFARYGQAGTWVSELLPWTAKLVDDIAVIKTVASDSVNHDPAILAAMTGSQLAGKPSLGAWLSYGLGSLNENLPTFVVMTSLFSQHVLVQALSSRLWGSAFLPGTHAGVTVRSTGDPVLFLQNPAGMDISVRRSTLDAVRSMNQHELERVNDPTIMANIEQHEMAFRMQSAVPELTDMSGESDATRALYGESVNKPGTFARNCLLARRMLERDVRFVQLYHRGWDSHDQLPMRHAAQCQEIDQACYGLVTDLKQRGLLDETLVIWGGEFGRTVFSQGELTATTYGRDHHPRCFSVWMAGGGIKPGVVHGETDDFGYNIVKDPVPLRDLHATILHQFGLDHDRLKVRYQGLDQKLVGVDAPARVVQGILT
jgi:Protein of unknown function (DUF1501)